MLRCRPGCVFDGFGHAFAAVAGQVDMCHRNFESGSPGFGGSGVVGAVTWFRFSQSPRKEKRNVEVNMKQHSKQPPVIGGIYRDKSGSSLVVVNVVGGKVLLEYANGTVTSVDNRSWQQLHPKISVY